MASSMRTPGITGLPGKCPVNCGICSEHEIGLAIDIVTSGYTSLNEGFGRTQAGKWLAAHSADYGFILRYPKGKESITGIEFEPWHFRYVGKEAAQRIAEEGICLEEFWDAYLYH